MIIDPKVEYLYSFYYRREPKRSRNRVVTNSGDLYQMRLHIESEYMQSVFVTGRTQQRFTKAGYFENESR